MHFPKSPRHVSIETAASLARRAAGRARTVVLTVDPTDELLSSLVASIQPDYIQLHGKESPARVREVAQRSGRGIIKVLPSRRARTSLRPAPTSRWSSI